MKLPGINRILLIFTAVALFFAVTCLFLELSYTYPVLEKAHLFLHRQDLPAMLTGIALGLVLLVLMANAILCVVWRGDTRGYIKVHSGGGELRISVGAIEKLVRQCLSTHRDIDVSSIYLSSSKYGLDVILRGVMPIGMDMPGAVTALQGEISEYLTSCSGVTVHEVNVLVDDTSGSMNVQKPSEPETPAQEAQAPVQEAQVPVQEAQPYPPASASDEETTLAEAAALDGEDLPDMPQDAGEGFGDEVEESAGSSETTEPEMAEDIPTDGME